MVPALEGLGFHPNTDKFYIQFKLCYQFQCSKAKSHTSKQSFLRFGKLWELTNGGQNSFGALKCHQLTTQCMSLVWAGFSPQRCCCRFWTAFPRHLGTSSKWLCEASTYQGELCKGFSPTWASLLSVRWAWTWHVKQLLGTLYQKFLKLENYNLLLLNTDHEENYWKPFQWSCFSSLPPVYIPDDGVVAFNAYGANKLDWPVCSCGAVMQLWWMQYYVQHHTFTKYRYYPKQATARNSKSFWCSIGMH